MERFTVKLLNSLNTLLANTYVYRGVRFVPSSYDTDITMNPAGSVLDLATGVKLGMGVVQIANRGVTTEAIRVAFGIDILDAINNLTIVSGAATTGYYIGAQADVDSQSIKELGVPSLATYIAVAPAITGKTNIVSITQGI